MARVFTPVSRKRRDTILKEAKRKGPRWRRNEFALARDNRGIYYYVDRLSRRFRGKSFRVFKGPRGQLTETPLVDIVDDSDERPMQDSPQPPRIETRFEWTELETRLPEPSADDRVELYHATRACIVSFPGHLEADPMLPSHEASEDDRLSLLQSIKHPADFERRTVFAHGDRVLVVHHCFCKLASA
ncbi:MAG: hypothetical protein GY811_09380 [Myxococcales bacterium]|nr:hypothetical protein [Myxococcales bacterium]